MQHRHNRIRGPIILPLRSGGGHVDHAEDWVRELELRPVVVRKLLDRDLRHGAELVNVLAHVEHAIEHGNSRPPAGDDRWAQRPRTTTWHDRRGDLVRQSALH